MKFKDSFWNKKARGLYFIIIFFCVAYLVAYYCIAEKKYEGDIIQRGDEINFIENMKEGDIIEQRFNCKYDTLSGIKMQFATFENTEKNAGEMKLTLFDEGSGQILFEKNMDISWIQDNQTVTIMFDKNIKHCKGRNLRLQIEVVSMDEDTLFTIMLSESEAYPEEILRINGRPSDEDICMQAIYQKTDDFTTIIGYTWLFLGLFTLVVYLLIAYTRIKPHNIYMILGLGLGLFYMMWILPRMVPDESSHLATAYALSNTMMGQDATDLDGHVYMRRCDMYSLYTTFPDRERFSDIYDHLFTNQFDDEIIQTQAVPLKVMSFQYIFSALGITAGRLLGLNGYLTLLLGRMANLLFFVLIVRYAISKLPFGNTTMALLALMPMCIQQSGSLSYDAIIIPLAFLTIALSVKILCRDEKIKIYEYIIYIIAALLLSLCKGSAYMPIAMIPLIGIFLFWKKDKNRSASILIAFCFIMILFFVLKLTGIGTSTYGVSESGNTGNIISWCNEEGYTFSSLIHQPQQIIRIIGATIYEQFDYYIETMVGNQLGWLAVRVPTFLLYLMLGMIILSVFKTDKDMGHDICKSQRIWTILLALLSCAMCIGGMLLSWTPRKSDAVLGVQGRYFIPIIPMILLMCRNNLIKLSKNIDRVLLAATPLIHCLVIYC
ncbi:MAG: DUF2142 domain-containing protein, partial [Lachnospiraceae bacterium]|nr:DUF2142 domain-containing protein [Lachnospiraceae bacterium]